MSDVLLWCIETCRIIEKKNVWSILIFTRLSHLGIYDKKIIHSATQKSGSFVDGSKWEVSGWLTISVWNPKNNLYAEKWNTWKVCFENMKWQKGLTQTYIPETLLTSSGKFTKLLHRRCKTSKIMLLDQKCNRIGLT